MKRSDRCKGWYCQLCWLVLLVHGMTLSLFHGDQLGQSNFYMARSGCCHILWSTTLVAAWRNLVDVTCRDATQKVFDRHIYCDGGCRQTSFIAGALALHCNCTGLQFSTINLIVSALAPSRLLKVMAQSPVVVRGSSLPCTAYATLMWLIVAWHDVHGHLSLWRETCCCLAWLTRPIALVVRGSLL